MLATRTPKSVKTEVFIVAGKPTIHAQDTVGKVFGRWTIEEFLGRNKYGTIRVKARCECGSTKEVSLNHLKRGSSQSCGCLRKENWEKYKEERCTPFERTRTYNSWACMKQRCNNPNNHKYPDYGGRGVTYDPRWESFECFLEDMGERPLGTSLDKDSIKPGNLLYCKEFCCWATPKVQATYQRKRKPKL